MIPWNGRFVDVLSSLTTPLLKKRELVALLWLCCGSLCYIFLPQYVLCWFAVCEFGIPWSHSLLAFPKYPHYSIMVWLKRMALLLAILLRFEKEDMFFTAITYQFFNHCEKQWARLWSMFFSVFVEINQI